MRVNASTIVCGGFFGGPVSGGLIGLVLAWVVYGRIFGYIFRISLAVLYPGSNWG